MPIDYVWALHDFHPENEDEVPFNAGDRVHVLERDDLYGDGWWKGKNPAGKEGLFPASYTTPNDPSAAPKPEPPAVTVAPPPVVTAENSVRSSAGLESIREHEEPAVTPSTATAPRSPSYLGYPSDDDVPPQPSPDEGRMMRATMTDVQLAIEQLGMRDNADDHASRTYSFASSRDTRSDHTPSETETEDGDFDRLSEDVPDDEDWHRDARTRLAEKARAAALKEQREREREEARHARALAEARAAAAAAPPIDVDFSDESEPEEGETMHNSFYRRALQRAAEEDEEDDTSGRAVDSPEPTATRESFGPIPPPAETLYLPADHPRAQRASIIYPPLSSSPAASSTPPPDSAVTATTELGSLPTPVSPSAQLPTIVAPIPIVAVQHSPPHTSEEPTVSMPVPVPASAPAVPASPPATQARDFAMATTAGLPSPAASASSAAPASAPTTGSPASLTKPATHPSEWSVDEVVEWLRSKGFDSSVCDRFVEQEISGDVLLELDANLLKSELGIAAFGKRVRIANAIAELRRPPSVASSEQRESVNGGQRPSAPSASGSPATHLSPITVPSGGGSHVQAVQTPASTAFSFQSIGPRSLLSTESSPRGTGESALPSATGTWFSVGGGSGRHARNVSDLSGLSEGVASSVRWVTPPVPGEESAPASAERAVFGLGLGVPINNHGNRPAQLALSPSDGALGARAIAESKIPEEVEEERTAVSEGEQPSTEKSKRRFFARLDSPAEDKSPSSPGGSARSDSRRHSTFTPSEETSSIRSLRSRHSKKRSLDTAREQKEERKSDRLSIFGGISGSIHKSRKPAPRYSAAIDNADLPVEKQASSGSSILSSLYHGSSKRSASQRPQTADGSGKQRAVSASNSPTTPLEREKDKKESVSAGEGSPDPSGTRRMGRESSVLRKRAMSAETGVTKSGTSASASSPAATSSSGRQHGGGLKAGQSILEQIGTPDHNGWMRKKGERYNSWKMRYFVLKGPHMYCLRSNSKAETKIKGYINITGYRVMPDENVDPGRYGFKILHDTDKAHYFSSEEQIVIREWMKALMKATITRDYKKPVVSSVNIPTIPLAVAQTMNPAPRPPSPGARDATQRALRRENTSQLSTRDAKILMGIPSADDGALQPQAIPQPGATRSIPSGFRNPPHEDPTTPRTPAAPPPPRPSRENRRMSSTASAASALDPTLVEWANSHLPRSLQITDTSGSVASGLQLLRLAEAIKGKPASPPVLDTAFPTGPTDDKLDGLFRLFDFLLDNDVRMGSVSINDVRQGRREKIIQVLKALRQWEDKRRQVAESLGRVNGSPTGIVGPSGTMPWGNH